VPAPGTKNNPTGRNQYNGSTAQKPATKGAPAKAAPPVLTPAEQVQRVLQQMINASPPATAKALKVLQKKAAAQVAKATREAAATKKKALAAALKRAKATKAVPAPGGVPWATVVKDIAQAAAEYRASQAARMTAARKP
jgi:hypothetical protein